MPPGSPKAPTFTLVGQIAELEVLKQKNLNRGRNLGILSLLAALAIMILIYSVYSRTVLAYAVLENIEIEQDPDADTQITVSFDVRTPGMVAFDRRSGTGHTEKLDMITVAEHRGTVWSWPSDPKTGIDFSVVSRGGWFRTRMDKHFRVHGEEVALEDDGRTVLEAGQRETGTPPPALPQEIGPVTRTVYLSDLDETDWSGHADFGKNGSSKTADVAVNGIKFRKGLWTHPTDRGSASVKYRLAGLDATAFVTKVAINDSTLPTIPTLLTFQVLGDGEILWTSTPTRQKGQMQECQISVKDVRVLELRVNCPGWYHGRMRCGWIHTSCCLARAMRSSPQPRLA